MEGKMAEPKCYLNGEFKFLSGPEPDVQMKLNQWRHQYDLEILKMGIVNAHVILLIYREKR